MGWLTTYVCKPPAERPWDILGWTDVISDEEHPHWKENQLKELNNGRLAMVGIIGLIIQTASTGDHGVPVEPKFFDAGEDFGKYVLPGRFLPLVELFVLIVQTAFTGDCGSLGAEEAGFLDSDDFD